MSNDNLYPAIIGSKNQPYYLSYFHRADARGYPPIAWHWPAFWIGLFWLLYRKQYRWALIYFIVPIAIVTLGSTADALLPGSGTAVVYGGLIGFQGIYFPLKANGIYYRWARDAVASARAQFPAQEDRQQEFLDRLGGVNSHLPFIIVGLLMLFSMLTSSITPA